MLSSGRVLKIGTVATGKPLRQPPTQRVHESTRSSPTPLPMVCDNEGEEEEEADHVRTVTVHEADQVGPSPSKKLSGIPVEEVHSEADEEESIPEHCGEDEDYLDEDDYKVSKWQKEILPQDEVAEVDYGVTVSVRSIFDHDADLPKRQDLHGSQADQLDPGKQVLYNCPLAKGCIYVPE